MFAYTKESITIPQGSKVGMDLPVDDSAPRTIRAELTVRADLVEPIYYHMRGDNPEISR